MANITTALGLDEVIEKADPHELHTLLVTVVSVSKKGFVAMGKILRELKKGDVYKKSVGAGVDTWETYLRQPEIGLATGEANRLIQIYEEMVLRLGYDEDTVADIPIKNAHYLLPLIKNLKTKDEADELVADATLLSQKDFRSRIVDKKIDEGETVLTYSYLLMKKTNETGTMERIMDIDSDTLKATLNLD